MAVLKSIASAGDWIVETSPGQYGFIAPSNLNQNPISMVLSVDANQQAEIMLINPSFCESEERWQAFCPFYLLALKQNLLTAKNGKLLL